MTTINSKPQHTSPNPSDWPKMNDQLAVDFFRTEHQSGEPRQCWRCGCVSCGWEFDASFHLQQNDPIASPVICTECGTNRAAAVRLWEYDTLLNHYPEVLQLVKNFSPDEPWMEF